MNLTTSTPVEIDTALAALYADETKAMRNVQNAATAVYRAAGAKRDYRRGGWTLSILDATATATALAADEAARTWDRTGARDALAAFDQARVALAEIRNAMTPLNDEYDRRPWTRAFLVQNAGGHVHSSMGCSTCNNGQEPTRFAWMTDYSGGTEAAIVQDAGERACTACYPSAPVDVLARPTKMFGPDEIAAQEARDTRAAEKVARDAAKAAKAITMPDGSELRDSDNWVVKTERTAEIGAVDALYSIVSWGGHPYDESWAAYAERAVTALAHKRGQTEEQVRALIEAKAAAKIKRDNC